MRNFVFFLIVVIFFSLAIESTVLCNGYEFVFRRYFRVLTKNQMNKFENKDATGVMLFKILYALGCRRDSHILLDYHLCDQDDCSNKILIINKSKYTTYQNFINSPSFRYHISRNARVSPPQYSERFICNIVISRRRFEIRSIEKGIRLTSKAKALISEARNY